MKAAIIVLFLTAFSSFGWSLESLKGFDTDQEARFNSVSVPVGMVQTQKDLQVDQAKETGKKMHARHDYFDKVIAIGLSPNEMKNLNVEAGELLQVGTGATQVMASVYEVTGDASPPQATINLSPAAAEKLKVKPGDTVVVQHPGDESLPDMVSKPTQVEDISTRASDQEGQL